MRINVADMLLLGMQLPNSLFMACQDRSTNVCEHCIFTSHVLMCIPMHAAHHLHHIQRSRVTHGLPPCLVSVHQGSGMAAREGQ